MTRATSWGPTLSASAGFRGAASTEKPLARAMSWGRTASRSWPSASDRRASTMEKSARARRAMRTSPNWRSKSTRTTRAPGVRARKSAVLAARNVFPLPSVGDATAITWARSGGAPPSSVVPERRRTRVSTRSSARHSSSSLTPTGRASSAPTCTISRRVASGERSPTSTTAADGAFRCSVARCFSPGRLSMLGPATITAGPSPNVMWSAPVKASRGITSGTGSRAAVAASTRSASSGDRSRTRILGRSPARPVTGRVWGWRSRSPTR
jgi:hypothetical protein